jgi:hypothetical protein
MMTKIDGLEVVDSYDVLTVHGTAGGEDVSVVAVSEEDALETLDSFRALGDADARITTATHYATEPRPYVPEMAPIG